MRPPARVAHGAGDETRRLGENDEALSAPSPVEMAATTGGSDCGTGGELASSLWSAVTRSRKRSHRRQS